MRVTVNTDVCQAHGDCVMTAPEVFDLDGDANWASVIEPGPSIDLHAAVQEAAETCPTGAIQIED